MEALQLSGYMQAVLMVCHAKPAVSRVQHRYLQRSIFYQLAHHIGQQTFGLNIISRYLIEKFPEVTLQFIENRRNKSPKVHRHHGFRRQLVMSAVCHIGN